MTLLSSREFYGLYPQKAGTAYHLVSYVTWQRIYRVSPNKATFSNSNKSVNSNNLL